MPTANESISDLSQRLLDLYQRLNSRPAKSCQVEFYPYSRFSSTIRLRNDVLKIRFSDLLADAPGAVVEAFGIRLVYRISGRRTPRSVSSLCTSFVNHPDTLHRERTLRRTRGRKRIQPAQGDVFDLRELFHQLNREFFESSLSVDQIGWSLSRSRRRLGHYDPAHHAIVINRRLDNPLVPEYVVSFVLFHEMLHACLAVSEGPRKRRVHDRRFREAESRHPDRRRAMRFIQSHF